LGKVDAVAAWVAGHTPIVCATTAGTWVLGLPFLFGGTCIFNTSQLKRKVPTTAASRSWLSWQTRLCPWILPWQSKNQRCCTPTHPPTHRASCCHHIMINYNCAAAIPQHTPQQIKPYVTPHLNNDPAYPP